MRILVTGGAGYIGTALVSQLSMMNDLDEIIVYDNLSRRNYNLFIANKFHHNKLRFIQSDILDSRRLKKALEGVDVVYHLAAKVSTPFASDDAHSFEQINHWGTAELVYALEENPVKQLIFLSSTSVYGSTSELVNEDSPLKSQSFYGISKVRGEQQVKRLSEQCEVHVIRCGNVYGYNPSMRFEAVINRFVFEAHYNNRINIHGSGKQIRAFVHIDSVAESLVRLIQLSPVGARVPSGTYNLVEQNLSILEISSDLKELYPKLEFIFIDQHMPHRNLQVDTNLKLSNHIGVKPRLVSEQLKSMKTCLSF
ncbi:MAG: SDR family oxidoreductase [Flavobacteriales bacterium]